MHGNITPVRDKIHRRQTRTNSPFFRFVQGNILVTEEGNACLGDFGIAAIITDLSVMERDSTTTTKKGAVHYMAPELLYPPRFGSKRSNHSKESDVFSFAMSTYEVFPSISFLPRGSCDQRASSPHDQVLSGVLPYSTGPETVIALQIATGDRPPRPDNPTANRWLLDPIWDVLQGCWGDVPESRFPISSLRRAFVELEPEHKGNIPVTENGGGKQNVV